ncbi:right-handed parallel beta-helix repeat-containing protein [Methanobrevibacter sp.]|uniref:right-handed parallel beta-helix repeat-containing protein n=1 Tax=Methanobrevibacter sp. TaxID=66852 RepID=UPI00388F3306
MKLKKPVLILLMFLMIFLCIGSVSALENQTDDSGEYEIIGADESPAISTASNGTYTDLAARIDDAIANNNSVLYLPYDFAYNEETDHEYNQYTYPDHQYYGILINKTLTINGNNHIISGSSGARIFTVNATDGTVTFNNITFADSAGAINTESELIINDCTFINNIEKHNVGSWGAILSNGGRITVTNSAFINNSAFSGGAINLMQADINTITGSVFINNTATGDGDAAGDGGAIYANAGLKLNIDNCTFTGNKALAGELTGSGGAIETYYDTNINNSKFNKNSAGSGSVIYAIGGIDPSSIIISNSNFTENDDSDEEGGAIFNLEDNVTIQSCTFDGNKGKSIYNEMESILYLSNNKISYDKTEICNNGGAIISTTNLTILSNKTVKVEYGQTVTLNATYMDDNGNLIYDTNFNFVVDGVENPIPATYDKGQYTAQYRADNIEQKIVSADLGYDVPTYSGLLDVVPSNDTVIVFAPNLTKYYKNSKKFTATVTDGKGQATPNKTVNITINGVTYSRTTDENGTAKLNINLNSGEYPTIVTVDDVIVNSTTIVKTTIDAADVYKVYKNDSQYDPMFLDSDGNPIEDTLVSFNINGTIYSYTTVDGGLELYIDQMPGDYIITATNPVTGEMRSNKITVISQIESNELTKYYKNESQFIVRMRNLEGEYIGAGEAVKFDINGVSYTRTTNATGHAKLNINLHQGNYTISTEYNDFIVSDNVEVLPILSADDLVMNYMDGSQFKAKLVDGQGKAYPNQSVTFNINGVLYNRTTDSEGVAKLNIRLQSGQYIITSSFNGCEIASKITIRS